MRGRQLHMAKNYKNNMKLRNFEQNISDFLWHMACRPHRWVHSNSSSFCSSRLSLYSLCFSRFISAEKSDCDYSIICRKGSIGKKEVTGLPTHVGTPFTSTYLLFRTSLLKAIQSVKRSGCNYKAKRNQRGRTAN